MTPYPFSKGWLLTLLIVSTSVLFVHCSLDLPQPVAIEMETLPKTIDFNYHVKPILSDRCYTCHGPAEKSRKAELRLDV